MNRLRTWDVDLLTWAETMTGKPFRWGRTDCGSLVRKSQRIIYGVDIFHLTAWTSKAQALETIADIKGMRALLRRVARPVGRGFLQMGDIVLVTNGCDALETDGLMVVVRDYAISTSPDSGVIRVPLEAIPAKATYWRVHVG